MAIHPDQVSADVLDAAVRRALERTGVDASFLRTVRDLLRRTDEQWRICCGSGCDPCVETLARAVEEARAELERSGGG